MIQDIFPRKLDNQYNGNAHPQESDYVIIFTGNNRKNDQILVRNYDAVFSFPTVSECRDIPLRYLFRIDERQFFLAEASDKIVLEGYEYVPVRPLRRAEPRWLSFAAFTAYHLFTWYRDVQYCGRCGHKTVHDQNLRMRQCPECGCQFFPKISPAVIIGLRNGNSLMMSRYAGREYKGRALLAGFCEIGETPEETVVREVMEEVGLRAKNVTYFGSQPWGIECDLLLGYFADVDGSIEVTLDENELASASFIPRNEIEYDPNLQSLTATMIEAFRKGEA